MTPAGTEGPKHGELVTEGASADGPSAASADGVGAAGADAVTAAGATIAPLDAAQLAELEPLWRALIDHIRDLGSVVELVPHEQSWPRRLAIYEGLLADGESFALGARRDGRLIGYALVHVAPPDAVWSTGSRYAELTSLCVAAGERGGGLGTALLDAAEARLAAAGIDQYVIGVDTVNEGAQRFYEKRGFRDGFHLMHGWVGGARHERPSDTGARAGQAVSGAGGATSGTPAAAGAQAAAGSPAAGGAAPDTPESIMRGID